MRAQTRAVRNGEIIPDAVETECLANLAGDERCSVAQTAGFRSNDVVGVEFCRPPPNDPCWNGGTDRWRLQAQSVKVRTEACHGRVTIRGQWAACSDAGESGERRWDSAHILCALEKIRFVDNA